MSETKRTATLSEGDAGFFTLDCADCPLVAHAKALEQKPPSCVNGIITNMQGAITLNSCKHYKKVSVSVEGGALFLACCYAPPDK